MRLTIAVLSLLGLSFSLACNDGTGPTAATRPALETVGRGAFAFNGRVSGFPPGEVRLTGGGSFDPATASNVVPKVTSVSAGGAFDCSNTVVQGPLNGCTAGQGVRWDTAQLLASTGFKCNASEGLRPASTNDHTVVLLAHFYRAGDGDDESFTGQMIVTDGDLDPDITGIQNLWVQGVGCGTAIVHFN